MRLFLYGTLKRGHSRHHLLANQQFVGLARTCPAYRLYDLGDYPGMVRAPDGLCIEGELWEVDEACARHLDRVEGCDVGLYRRESVELSPPHNETPAMTYLYEVSVLGRPDRGTKWDR